METFIQRDHVAEVTPGRFGTEASTLGWVPNFWPDTISTELGNGRPLVKYRADSYAVVYRQEEGCEVVVYND